MNFFPQPFSWALSNDSPSKNWLCLTLFGLYVLTRSLPNMLWLFKHLQQSINSSLWQYKASTCVTLTSYDVWVFSLISFMIKPVTFLEVGKCKQTWCWRNFFGISFPICKSAATPKYAKSKLAPTKYLSKCSEKTINKGIVFKKVFKKTRWHLIQSKPNKGFGGLHLPSVIIPQLLVVSF